MILSLSKISKTYQTMDSEVKAVEEIDLDIKEGEFISIVGPSGCGKSTLLTIIAGLEEQSSGKLLIDGEETKGTSEKIGYMPQKDQLFQWRNIWDNVCLGLEIRKQKTEKNCALVRALLKRYGLEEFSKKVPSQLSGGMRQRCALIRTLATNPSILLLDEPFSALDYQTRLEVSDDIYEIIKREKKTAILVTHDISESISMSDRVVVLSNRPAKIKNIHDLKDFERLSPMERRNHIDFKNYFNQIWEELQENE